MATKGGWESVKIGGRPHTHRNQRRLAHDLSRSIEILATDFVYSMGAALLDLEKP